MFNKSMLTLAFAGAAFLQGCASMSTMETHEMTDVPTHTFAASKAMVVLATQKSIEELGYNLKNTKASEPTSEIYFSKPMSAFSWGEVGRIDVKTLSPTSTEVMLSSEKRYQLQLTGTSQKEFSKKVFGQIGKNISQQ